VALAGASLNTVQAQQPNAKFAVTLKSLETQFTNLERRLVAKTKTLEAQDTFGIDNLSDFELSAAISKYGANMMSAFDISIASRKSGETPQGKAGTLSDLRSYEALADAHAKRLKALQARTDAINDRIKSGLLLPDKTIVSRINLPDGCIRADAAGTSSLSDLASSKFFRGRPQPHSMENVATASADNMLSFVLRLEA
jgi:hypothetical protein